MNRHPNDDEDKEKKWGTLLSHFCVLLVLAPRIVLRLGTTMEDAGPCRRPIFHLRAGLLELLEYHARRLLSVYVFGDDMQDTEVHWD
jgi:hypothetical protein